MEPDWIESPQAFIEANRKAHIEHLRSLTMEKAAEELEALLASWPQIEASLEGLDVPPPRPRQLPGPTLAILLGE